MASTVHYKFKSQKDYDSIEFDGMFISVGDLKRQITDKRGLGRDQAMELQLTNAQTNEEYEDDAVLVWMDVLTDDSNDSTARLKHIGGEHCSFNIPSRRQVLARTKVDLSAVSTSLESCVTNTFIWGGA